MCDTNGIQNELLFRDICKCRVQHSSTVLSCSSVSAPAFDNKQTQPFNQAVHWTVCVCLDL